VIQSRHKEEAGTVSNPWLDCIRIELAGGVRVEHSGCKWCILTGAKRISFNLPPGDTSTILSEIQSGGVPLYKVAALQDRQDGSLSLSEQIGRLWRGGLLVESISHRNARIAVLHNPGEAPLIPAGVTPADEITMTEEGCIRYEEQSLLMESTASGSYVQITSHELSWFPVPVTRAIRCAEWAQAAMLPQDVILALANWLAAIGVLRVNHSDQLVPRRPLGWSFADRMMYARSRNGRHVGGYGGTYRRLEQLPEPPAVQERWDGPVIPLLSPDIAEITKHDPPFTEVLEQRHSTREHGQSPLSLEKLGEFLYRTCRVTRHVVSQGKQIALRPYPSGGSCHELEIYPLVNKCSGLDAGLYRYNGSTHSLFNITRPESCTKDILDYARLSCGMRGEPHVLLLITARFLLVNYKYESLAYSLILKNVGVLFQTMYLVATAMELGACALGGGLSDAFCRAAKTDFWQENTVGEFMLGEMGAS